jgi:hypothetical protein
MNKKDLKFIADSLPIGGMNKIVEKSGYSQSYISKFFNGEYNLTEKNIHILDLVDEVLEADKKFHKEGQKKLNKLLSTSKEHK